MLTDFAYNPDDDDSVSLASALEFTGKSVRISACTIQGSKDGVAKKPNEDAFSIVSSKDKLFLAVFDGTSSQKPTEWLADQTGARFASHFVKNEFERIAVSCEPSKILHELNSKLREEGLKRQSSEDTDILTLPATTATVAIIDFVNNMLHISNLGDSFCILFYGNGTSDRVTEDGNDQYDHQLFVKINKIAKAKQISPREARKDPAIDQAVKDMFRDTHNTPDGSGQGIITGEPTAEQYIQYDTFPIRDVTTILLGSDGLVPPGIDEHTTEGRTRIIEILKNGGLKSLIREKLKAEDNDPEWNHIRYKHSDDATGIYIVL